jgi:hypothetical protein
MVDTSRQFAEAIARVPQPNNQVEPLGCSLGAFLVTISDHLKV